MLEAPDRTTPPNAAAETLRVKVLIPIYDDWTSLDKLLRLLDDSLAEVGGHADVLIINDASPTDGSELDLSPPWRSLERIEMLDLRRNLGHQRAMAIGMALMETRSPGCPVVLMDGDGEDSPADVPRLYEACRQTGFTHLIFARRSRRYETWVFRMWYWIYQGIYKTLIGQGLRVGNFSIIPPKILRRLVVVSDLWNHYPAAVMKARIPHKQLPLDRGKRIAGQSKMNYVALVAHGLSSISVNGDTVGTRMLILTCGMILSGLIGIATIFFLKTETDLAIPGWATSAAGLTILLIFQACMLSLGFILVILGGRNTSNFIPSRDFQPFVDEVRQLWPPLGTG